MCSETSISLACPLADADDNFSVPASCAFESQLRSLCLKEFPCGLGSWRSEELQAHGKKSKLKQIKNARLLDKYSITLRDYGPQHEMVETLAELATSKRSPWTVDYDWSNDARALRELAVRSPWKIDDQLIWNHFKSLRILDTGVTEVDENLLRFKNLEELTLTANYIQRVDSQNLPRTLKFLELCANEICDLSDLCTEPPPLIHLGLGYNQLTAVGDFLSSQYWPELRSLDLSHNHLVDLAEVIGTLHSLPKLRNLVLSGNPFTLVPAYRGYTIDLLRRLEFLDDTIITADEKHYFKGLSKMTECNITDVKMLLSVPVLRGILPPEEILNPDDFPEFPKISRKYFVRFMLIHDAMHESNYAMELVLQSNEISPVTSAVQLTPAESAPSSAPVDIKLTPTGLPLAEIRSTASEWTGDDMELNWVKVLTVSELRMMRDFCKEGMEISVVEEKILSYPVEEGTSGESIGLTKQRSDLGTKQKDGKAAKGKPDKKPPPKIDPKAGKTKGKKPGGKKKGEPEVPMVQSPAEYSTLASFHIPLEKYLDADFGSIEATFRKEHPPQVQPLEMVSGDKKKKDKKGAADQKSQKKDTKGGKDKKVKGGKQGGKGSGDDDDGSVPPLEVDVLVKLGHWKNAADAHKRIEDL